MPASKIAYGSNESLVEADQKLEKTENKESFVIYLSVNFYQNYSDNGFYIKGCYKLITYQLPTS